MILAKLPSESVVQKMGRVGAPGTSDSTAATVALGSGFPSALWTMPRITVPWDSFIVSRAAGALNAFLVVTDFQPNFETRSE